MGVTTTKTTGNGKQEIFIRPKDKKKTEYTTPVETIVGPGKRYSILVHLGNKNDERGVQLA